MVLTALQLIRRQMPFPLRGIDADNDPVVMNQLMEAWCDSPGQQIVLTQSRAYKSNDQAWVGHPRESRGRCPRDSLGTPVEQKNGMLVRRMVGYQRLMRLEAAQVLWKLYGALRLFTNLFQPSFKLKSSERDGGRIKRQHHPPRTPLQRLLATGQVSEERADQLRELQRGTGHRPGARTSRCGSHAGEPFAGGVSGGSTDAVAVQPAASPQTEDANRKANTARSVRGRRGIDRGLAAGRAAAGLRRADGAPGGPHPQRYSDRQMRTLQRRLRNYWLQRIELEMAEAGEVQFHANEQEAGDPGGAVGLMRPAPWGLATCPGRGEQANNTVVSNVAAAISELDNRTQVRTGHSREPVFNPSLRTTPLPRAMRTQCYQVTTIAGNKLLMQSARPTSLSPDS
ncbi:MAG TPA: hypothetical protein DDY43_00200 [Synechococcales bacterium UBA10510]|nr:hypothetical protein [Synechococcales bacterium UBA10510]